MEALLYLWNIEQYNLCHCLSIDILHSHFSVWIMIIIGGTTVFVKYRTIKYGSLSFNRYSLLFDYKLFAPFCLKIPMIPRYQCDNKTASIIIRTNNNLISLFRNMTYDSFNSCSGCTLIQAKVSLVVFVKLYCVWIARTNYPNGLSNSQILVWFHLFFYLL